MAKDKAKHRVVALRSYHRHREEITARKREKYAEKADRRSHVASARAFEQEVVLLHDAGLTWSMIAHLTGKSLTGCAHAYYRATDPTYVAKRAEYQRAYYRAKKRAQQQ